ncbi:hypothetical protein AVEN_223019-1 [Araneus ventricosus]|uniref:Uncharacterized protein n=1 Tax=Araneus ventricosus TaxID=182803 RepID=A0A4Y2QV18_ARAVE|nr:hypothetical protein AVEN_223019-1 [Araneus ventricosus]
MDNRLTEPEYEGLSIMEQIKIWSTKQKEGRPPTEDELATCAAIQEQDRQKIITRQDIRKARKRLKKSKPNSEAAIKAAKDVDRYKDAMRAVDEVLRLYGQCPVLNCTKHPLPGNDDTNNELDATSCTEMDTTSLADDNEQTTTPPVEENSGESEFQMVPPRKAQKYRE